MLDSYFQCGELYCSKMFLSGKKGGLHANVRKDFMETDLKIALMRRILSTTRAAVTIGLVIALLLMVAFCIDCSRYASFHDVSGGHGNDKVSW